MEPCKVCEAKLKALPSSPPPEITAARLQCQECESPAMNKVLSFFNRVLQPPRTIRISFSTGSRERSVELQRASPSNKNAAEGIKMISPGQPYNLILFIPIGCRNACKKEARCGGHQPKIAALWLSYTCNVALFFCVA